MLIIIDAQIFSNIVYGDDEYKPIFSYVSFGKGYMVYGGQTYERELTKHKKFFSLFTEWDRQRKTVQLQKDDVDRNEGFLQVNFVHKDYDDHHILAMVIYSGTEIICSIDRGLHALVKECYSDIGKKKIDSNCYHNCPLKRPRIYQGKQHKHMLV